MGCLYISFTVYELLHLQVNVVTLSLSEDLLQRNSNVCTNNLWPMVVTVVTILISHYLKFLQVLPSNLT